MRALPDATAEPLRRRYGSNETSTGVIDMGKLLWALIGFAVGGALLASGIILAESADSASRDAQAAVARAHGGGNGQ
jgi:hypothetical protein